MLSPKDARRTVIAPSWSDTALRQLTLAANHGKLWMTIAVVMSLIGKRQRRAGLRGLGSLAGASLVSNTVLKPLIGRRRPTLDPAHPHPLVRMPWTSSFPSGHSASAAAFAVGAALERPRTAAVLFPLAAAVGYSRVHVGVHYPSDVIAGAAIGGGIAPCRSAFVAGGPHHSCADGSRVGSCAHARCGTDRCPQFGIRVIGRRRHSHPRSLTRCENRALGSRLPT
ncbi:phosphatase PAP2 family protein [Williamsia sp. R60]